MSTLVDRILQSIPLRNLFQVLASILAWITLASLVGGGTPRITHSDLGDGRLTALDGSPLAVVYRLLSIPSIPNEWVSTTGIYLNDHSAFSATLGTVAVLLGWGVNHTLSSTGDNPSLQASTWWVCACVALQCGMFWGLLIWLVIRLFYLVLRGRPKAVYDFQQLIVAALFWLYWPVRLILHNTSAIVQDPEHPSPREPR